MRRLILGICLIFGPNFAAPAQPAATSPDNLRSYADVAELALAAPVIVRATIATAKRPPGKPAQDVPAGRVRLLVTATLSNVIRAPAAIGGNISWLWDAPVAARGAPPKLKGQDILAFVDQPDSQGLTRLVTRRSQQPWDGALADRVRAILAEHASGQVPVVTRVANGFRAEGTVPGESESQFFLATADGKPATLVVQNRPGEVQRIMVARGDIIDESAQRVKPDTLLWYRLACALPARLPAAAGGNDPALARDWADAMTSLGPCGKTG